MKIAFFVNDLTEMNGWSRYSVQIIKRLARKGVEPVIFSMRGSRDNPAFRGYAHHPILTSYHDDWKKPFLLMRDRMAVNARIEGCSALHVMVEPFLPLAYLCAGRNRKVIGAAVGTYTIQPLKTIWAPLYKASLRRCDSIISISRYTADRLIEEFPQAAPLTVAVPLGVEMDSRSSFPPASQREMALMTTGEVKPRKGVLQTVQALAPLAKDFPDVKFYIVGSASPGPYVDEIKRETARLGLERNVVWKGRISQEELSALYGRVRGFVLPSQNVGLHFEGFGLVHLEANALGVPAIGSRDCGNEDAIEDGVSGFLVKQGDTAGLAAAMRKLIDPAFAWDDLSQSAFAFARKMSWDRTVEGYLEAYRRLLGSSNA